MQVSSPLTVRTIFPPSNLNGYARLGVIPTIIAHYMFVKIIQCKNHSIIFLYISFLYSIDKPKWNLILVHYFHQIICVHKIYWRQEIYATEK